MLQVTPGSIADQCGLKAGDAVLQINNRSTDELSHDDAKGQILVAGQSFTMVVKRYNKYYCLLSSTAQLVHVKPSYYKIHSYIKIIC
jgi:C-terminal processing protease CtpA/Prc